MNWFKKLFGRIKQQTRKNVFKIETQSYNQEEMLRIEKQNFRIRKDYIDNFLKEFQEQELIKKRAYQEKINNENYQHNHKCPRCKSTKIIQVYKRLKGEINDSQFNLHTNGELHGTLDTYKVNQCKSCGHEFEYKKQIYLWYDDYYYDKIDINLNSYLFLYEIRKVIEELNNFNPNKLTEECNTIEEKKIQLSKKLKECNYYEKIMNYPIEVIIYAALQENFGNEQIINFGKYKDDFDVQNYMAKLTPIAHDLMTNYLGFKYHFN